MEEANRSVDLGDYYKVASDSRDLNYNLYFTEGNNRFTEMKEYTSDNTKQLYKKELKELLLSLDFVQKELADWKK